MSNIVCFDTDFQNPKVYGSMEDLLKEIKGSKNQAQRALNEPTNNFRGYKLMEQDKIPEIFSNLLTEREDKIRSEYGDNIEDLEKRLERAEKKERQAKFKVDDLEDTYTQKFEKFEQTHKDDLVSLTDKHNEYLITLETDFNSKIETLNKKVKAEMVRVVTDAEKSEKSLIESYSNHINQLGETITEYRKSVVAAKETHLKAVESLNKKYRDYIAIWGKNLLLTAKYMEKSRDNIYANMQEIVKVLNGVVEKDQQIHRLKDDKLMSLWETLPELKDKTIVDLHILPLPHIDLKDYLPADSKEIKLSSDSHLRKETTTLTVEAPVGEKVNVELEEVSTTVKPKKDVKVENTAVVQKDVEVKPAPVAKTVEKESEQIVSKKVEEDNTLDERFVVRGVTLKSKREFEELSTEAQGFYLCSMAKKGIHPEEILHLTTADVREYIANDPIISEVFVSEVIAQGLKYSECEDYLIFVDAPTIIEKLGLTKDVVDDFLEVKPPTPAPKTETDDNKSTTRGLPENAIKFNWGKYIEILEQNEDMEELLDQDSLTMRDLQQVIDVPARQASSMMGVLKRLGYIKDFENERVVSRMETIFLIVVSSSHKAQKKNVESLDTLIQRLYPSWILYREKNNV